MGDGDDFGDGPDEPGKLSGDSDDDFVDVFAAGAERSVSLAQAHLRLPGQILQFRRQMTNALL